MDLSAERSLLGQEINSLWPYFIHLYEDLFRLTNEEYEVLKKSKIEELEDISKKKSILLEEIDTLDKKREEILERISLFGHSSLPTKNNSSTIKEFLLLYHLEDHYQNFSKLNDDLISIIEKTRRQNKNNQVLLARALNFIREVKGQALGQKYFQSYSSKGKEILKAPF